jgi:ribose 5-phosphate isomerase B
MMTNLSDSEIQEIVQRVVSRLHLESTSTPAPVPSSSAHIVAIGADHGGFVMKEELRSRLEKNGYTVIDCGTNGTDAVDYPDFAEAVARKVSSGEAWRGIVIDGAGIGSCMAANKVPGVRAAMCYDHASAVNSREHNDANVLTLGAGMIGLALARQIVDAWLHTEFGGGRHAKRVDKIMAIESREYAR